MLPFTLLDRLAKALACACVILGCATSPSSATSREDFGAQGLVPYVLGQPTGLMPQIDSVTGRGDSSLVYRVADDGRSIGTRFLGPSEAVGAPLRMRTEREGEWHRLLCYVPRSDFQVTLAKWRIDAAGQMVSPHVRLEPFLEWRALGLEPGQLVTDVEWRPLVDGVGVGEWRR